MMARRRGGRELVEVFKELSESPPAEAHRPARLGEDKPLTTTRAQHTLSLGDRRQVTVYLSMGWVYGIIFFLVILTALAFAMGRQFAPVREAAAAVEAPEEFVIEARQVGEVTRPNVPVGLSDETAAGRSEAEEPAGVSGTAEAEPEVVEVTPVAPAITSGNMYAVMVVTYFNRRGDTEKAEDVVRFLTANGYENVRMLVHKESGNLVVTAGSFPTTKASEAQRVMSGIKELSYKGSKAFSTAYFTTLKGYQER